MVTLKKGGTIPQELQDLEEGEAILEIAEVTYDPENKYKDEVKAAFKIKWKTTDGATFLSSMGASYFSGQGQRGPAKFRDMLDKAGIPVTENEEDGTESANEQLLIGRKAKCFVEKTASGWPKVSKVLRFVDGAAAAAEAAVADGLPA